MPSARRAWTKRKEKREGRKRVGKVKKGVRKGVKKERMEVKRKKIMKMEGKYL